MTVTIRQGDSRALIDTLPDGSVSLVACSPPFLKLRSYLPDDHPDKDAEIGTEPDPATFVQSLLDLTTQCGRKLAPWGSIAFELGDSYAGSGGAGGDYNEGGFREGQQKFAGSARGMTTSSRRDKVDVPRQNASGPGWPLPKSLALIPQAYALSLAYGFNVLTGEPCEQWMVRNYVTWHRNNPSPGALADKYRPSTSYITIATRDRARWFDGTAVRTSESDEKRQTKIVGAKSAANHGGNGERNRFAQGTDGGGPPLTAWFDGYDDLDLEHLCWTINTQPSPLAHFAMWPPKLAERLILSMCPKEVCTACGEPRRRIEVGSYASDGGPTERTRQGRGRVKTAGAAGRLSHHDHPPETGWERERERETIGWSDCGCNAPFTPGVVLDPFFGAGTTAAVTDLHGRDAIGFELNQTSIDLYDRRRAECARNLFDSPMPNDNQLVLL